MDKNTGYFVKGIGDDDRIVTLGQHTLRPGAEIVVTSATQLLDENADMSVEDALTAAKKKRESDDV